jgi:hypothetical protein
MSKVTSIEIARNAKAKKSPIAHDPEGFTPCSRDLTICGDCEDNRAKTKCPRLKERQAKKTK